MKSIEGGGKNKEVRGQIYLFVSRKISALNRLNSQINVLMYMSEML